MSLEKEPGMCVDGALITVCKTDCSKQTCMASEQFVVCQKWSNLSVFRKGDPGHTCMCVQLLASTLQWSPKRTDNRGSFGECPLLGFLCNDAALDRAYFSTFSDEESGSVPCATTILYMQVWCKWEPVGTGRFCLQTQTASIKSLFARF